MSRPCTSGASWSAAGTRGSGLGGQLLDWAGLCAGHDYGARWVRVDVWTTNTWLHAYYRGQGFTFCDYSPVRNYPSAALFQKRINQIRPPATPLFHAATGSS